MMRQLRGGEMSSVLVNPATLIDALITTNIKLYFAQNRATRDCDKIIILNTKRHKLINEINENFSEWLQGKNLYPIMSETKDY